jgi:hypothetical protein
MGSDISCPDVQRLLGTGTVSTSIVSGSELDPDLVGLVDLDTDQDL